MVRIATLNVCNGYGNQPEAFLRLFDKHKLDVVCLQEMNASYLGKMMETAQQRGGPRPFTHSVLVRAGFIGNAIISRYPIRSSCKMALNQPGAYQRGAVLAEIETPTGLLNVVCVHLDHMREPTRLQQATTMFEALAEKSLPEGYILCGDFNALHRLDYSEEEWQAIADVREGAWEAPMQELMADIMGPRGFVDALRESAGLPNHSQVSGIDGTCRFDTRIDFLLRTEHATWQFARDAYRVISTKLTDHSLVTVVLERSEPVPEAELSNTMSKFALKLLSYQHTILGRKQGTAQKNAMGFEKEISHEGTGANPQPGQRVTVHCTGYGKDGDLSQKFWSTKDEGQRPFTFNVGMGTVIRGWDEGVLSMKLGERARLTCTPDYAYGERGFPAWGIQPNSTLIFDIEVLTIE